ncbi:MAG: RNA-binding transcriptional accessory protein [Gemmatimonadales bacterium]|nr:RNA-binding transcriptional accessory protein [Gemmatimonadales bacterium]
MNAVSHTLDSFINITGTELGISARQIRATAELLSEGASVPFISRYRKEATGSLDEVAVMAIRDRLQQLEDLQKRRQAILKSLKERELLTEDLASRISNAETLANLEDIYLPFRPKRRTRAMIAREKGLEPLASWLLDQAKLPGHEASNEDPTERAVHFIDPEKEVADAGEALAGARDIISEIISEDPACRSAMRDFYATASLVRSRVLTGKESEGAKFRDYFDWEEPVRRVAGHRILAMRRGEKEKILSMRVKPPEENALTLIQRQFVRNDSPCGQQTQQALEDGYGRLLSVAMETEIRLEMKKRADEEAIGVFAENLRELLLAPPLGPKVVLALDPGFRTGCKLVILDPQGSLLLHDTIYPHTGDRNADQARDRVAALVKEYEVEAIAIGNGTAGRETEAFIRALDLPGDLLVVMVNESGASIYSASQTARDEFPDLDLTVRGAVSIGRRLMDPLGELVKIEAKSIGVGQYQHDVDQKALKSRLDDTVTSCVNSVGVDVNIASKELLTYVSGLGPQLAGNIVDWRAEQGAFTKRSQLKKVPRLGPKAFEQAAGFLRINGGTDPLDASAVHPESYTLVRTMASDRGCAVADLIGSAESTKIDLSTYVTDTVGLPTLQDILAELAKPGRDPRAGFETFSFAEGVHELKDLTEGMKLPGIVTNVTNFGAFIDVGVHQDGLAHISQLADRFVRDPNEVVKVGQTVMATVLDVDLERLRISLSLKGS